jgi:hypothetical protein
MCVIGGMTIISALLVLQQSKACFLPFAFAPILHLPVEDEDAL